jgi:hypothetical protein
MMYANNIRIGAAWLICVALIPSHGTAEAAPKKDAAKVSLLRVPNKGIQPQVALDTKGVVHLIYFRGDPAGGDIFYVRSKDAATFSRPLRVNSKRGSAVAIGNIRGAHLAVGKNGRIHVAWMGSGKGEPKDSGKPMPMLYTRLNNGGTAFEPQRNVIRSAVGLDGGGSVAADQAGNVYVAWHAPPPDTRGEEHRCVWIAVSTNEGKTFSPEKRAYAKPTGACGCCGMRAFADRKGTVYLLYRSAADKVHRDMYLLTSTEKAARFRGVDLHPWKVETCPMSSGAFAEVPAGVLTAWETEGQVYYTRIDRAAGKREARPRPVPAPGRSQGRKHPVVAANAKGETILVWTEGMGWNRGGFLAWQIFDKSGKPSRSAKAKGQADGVPTWSLVAVFPRADGGFTIVY